MKKDSKDQLEGPIHIKFKSRRKNAVVLEYEPVGPVYVNGFLWEGDVLVMNQTQSHLNGIRRMDKNKVWVRPQNT